MSPANASEDETPAPARPRRLPKGGPTAADKRRLKGKLLAMRTQLLRSSKDLADEVLKSSGQDFSVDHMADYGSDNFEQDFSLSLLEEESGILQRIDEALAKIDGEADLPFGACENCIQDDGLEDPWIPSPRLDVVPYARLCVLHQEEEEEEGGA